MSKAKNVKRDAEEILTLPEAEKIIGVHHMTMMKYVWDGKFPAYKNEHGYWRVKKSDFLKFKEAYDKAGGNKSGRKIGEPNSRTVKNNIRISLEHGKKIAILSIELGIPVHKLMEDYIDKAFANVKERKKAGHL